MASQLGAAGGVLLCVWASLSGLSAGGCNRRPAQPAVESRPSEETSPAATDTRPAAPTTRPQPANESAPASRPVTRPASVFDTEPPYTVELSVNAIEDEQPGWLRILAFEREGGPAHVRGTFPRQNRIEVKTENVRRLQIEVGYLPLAQGRRISLHIDEQGIELVRRERRFVTLERRPTGLWIIEPEPKE